MYDAQDRLLSYGGTSYTYTANGERRTKTDSSGTTTYTFDVRGNLVQVDLPSSDVIQYLVDGQDRRVGKKKNGVLERAWLYRNQLNPVAELDGSGALVSRFVYGSKSNVPEYMVRGGITYRVLSDHLGSPRALVNVANGAVAWRADFDAWGNRTVQSGTADFLPFGFAGGMLDAETGLTRFGARDYDPAVGRWVSKDPIRFRSNEFSLYAYAMNDPVNHTDRTGLAANCDDCRKVTRTICEQGCISVNPACYLFGSCYLYWKCFAACMKAQKPICSDVCDSDSASNACGGEDG
ncbi:MAG: RHS domain-containing protein [Myxococcales bacterium]|nr:RHS domain-containing protein [Myxococcales bacterium]